ncbi:MAG: hypothetical protein DHS20C15_19770 [Planctomycetota bacterium]|nr:MAG: hypothetical protein DHS20C15_19770 [Planctomycetota bacterium]
MSRVPNLSRDDRTMAKRTTSRMKGATGIFLGEDSLVVTTLRRRSVRSRKLESFELAFGPEGPAAALRQLADEGRLAHEVVCGLDPRRIFSITRKLGADEQEREPSELLNRQLTSFEGGVVAAMQAVKLPSGTHHHMVAVQRSTAVELHEVLAERGGGSQRFVPVPVALMHLARRSQRQPRRWHTALRLMPGDEHGVIALCHDDTALAWQLYDSGDRESLLIAVLGLRSHAQDELGMTKLDGMILHAGDDNAALAESLAKRFEIPCLTAPEVRIDAHTMSHALALSGLRPQWEDLDLFSDLRPHGGFRHNFPSRVVPALLLLIAGLSTYLWMEVDTLEIAVAKVNAQIERDAARAGAQVADLTGLHDKRERELNVIHAFVVRRVFWEDYLRELPKVVPNTLNLQRLDGRDAVILKKKSASAVAKLKLFSVTGDVALNARETQPREIAQLTQALQSSELFQSNFPVVEGSNVRLQSGKSGAEATIAVTCKPPKGWVGS